jgi:hypothetical protein
MSLLPKPSRGVLRVSDPRSASRRTGVKARGHVYPEDLQGHRHLTFAHDAFLG